MRGPATRPSRHSRLYYDEYSSPHYYHVARGASSGRATSGDDEEAVVGHSTKGAAYLGGGEGHSVLALPGIFCLGTTAACMLSSSGLTCAAQSTAAIFPLLRHVKSLKT